MIWWELREETGFLRKITDSQLKIYEETRFLASTWVQDYLGVVGLTTNPLVLMNGMRGKIMTIEQAVLENLRELQPQEQQEVLNFVQFLRQKSTQKLPRRSLYGLWSDLSIEITAADIAEVREEMWGDFPKECPL